MAYTAKQKSYINQFRAEWIVDNRPNVGRRSTRDFNNSAEWTIEEREDYNKDLAKFIATSPHIFTHDQVAVAREVENTPIRQLDIFTLGDAARVFFGEAANQAQRINPFSAMNSTALWIVGGLAIVTISVVFAYRVTPKIPVKK